MLIVVTTGGTLFGIAGAFLAVPVVTVAATVLRYVQEQIGLLRDHIDLEQNRHSTPKAKQPPNEPATTPQPSPTGVKMSKTTVREGVP